MSPRDVILVPLDGSDLAERTLTVAAALARRRGSALRLVHVHQRVAADPIHVEGLPVIDEHFRSLGRNHERAYLERVRGRLAAGVSTSALWPKLELMVIGEVRGQVSQIPRALRLDRA